MTEKLFLDGISFFPPREGAPDFVIGALSIKPDSLIKALNTNMQYIGEKGFLKLDVMKSKGGKYYVEINTYRKDDDKPLEGEALKQVLDYKESVNKQLERPNVNAEGINPDDIPF